MIPVDLVFTHLKKVNPSVPIATLLRTNLLLRLESLSVRRSLNLFVLFAINLATLQMYVETTLTEMQSTILMLGMCPINFKVIDSHVECMDIDQLSADMEQIILYHICIQDQMVTG